MPDPTRRIDRLTIIGLAATAYVVTTLLHEGLGHGGACVVVGGVPKAWGAYYFDCEATGLPAQIVAAAGSTVNLIVAILTGLALKMSLANPHAPRKAGTVFIWLMFALNAFTWAGYFLFSGVGGFGDWGTEGVLSGVPNPILWRIVMAVLGGGLYLWLGRLAGRMLGQIIGGDDKAAGRKLALTAYFTGGVLAILIGLMNPIGFVIVLISSMASSLGGTSGLCWLNRFMRPEPEASFVLTRNWLWVVTGVVATVLYASVFGPTLKL